MSNELTNYFCPLQEAAFVACEGCPFLTSEGGKWYCHLASKNFMFDDRAAALGLFPIVFPREYHCAEIRFITQGGEKVAQINTANLEGTEETQQKSLAMDSKPCKLSYFRRRKRA